MENNPDRFSIIARSRKQVARPHASRARCDPPISARRSPSSLRSRSEIPISSKPAVRNFVPKIVESFRAEEVKLRNVEMKIGRGRKIRFKGLHPLFSSTLRIYGVKQCTAGRRGPATGKYLRPGSKTTLLSGRDALKQF
ncbi:hypothetical protein EVAR_26408_1 [Eumeta japonica]|uniref:Uncharacterized protein n=1 Tax=Eumeta variegata TaxID=151549 RepID=A0A4C1VSG6_EUMVA|nr:hypothetical protein EVAR_26408_1 [Eumeta japonica]